MRLIYLPIEPYEERYTYQLLTWTVARAKQRPEINLTVIEGSPLTQTIETGLVLDAYGRTHYALTQTANLVKLLQGERLSRGDVIYIADMFHPGWEALPYILAQLPGAQRPALVTRCMAQSVDPYDFTFPMRAWMRHYECLVAETASIIFVASTVHKQMLEAAIPGLHPWQVVVTGLQFDSQEVRARVPQVPNWHDRPRRIVFTSRFDREKQPHFWMDLVETAKQEPNALQDMEFAVCTGAASLRSNDPTAVKRARYLQAAKLMTVHEGLTKNKYYDILANSRVQFNCALQDFVSNTLNEAAALGTPSLLPAYLSFPEAAFNDRRMLYVPWSLTDALAQLEATLRNPPLDMCPKIAAAQDRSIDRELDAILEVRNG